MHFILQKKKHTHNKPAHTHTRQIPIYSIEYIWVRCGIWRISNCLLTQETHKHKAHLLLRYRHTPFAHIVLLCLTVTVCVSPPKQTSGEWTQFCLSKVKIIKTQETQKKAAKIQSERQDKRSFAMLTMSNNEFISFQLK